LNNDREKQIIKLNKAIQLLNSDEKALITLFYLEEKTISEITLISGLTANNIKVKLHRIRKKIYVLMKQEDKL
jgi:RNA polymerase sigma factor (sigma-70 family)